MFARIRKSIEENDEGFTLIELLVVIIIIGILAAIAIPVFLNQRQKGYDAQTKSDLRNLATAEETYLTDNPTGYLAGTGKAEILASALGVTDGWKGSPNEIGIAVNVDGANGYCAVAESQSTKLFYYDSTAGGLSATAPTGGECAGAAGTPTPAA